MSGGAPDGAGPARGPGSGPGRAAPLRSWSRSGWDAWSAPRASRVLSDRAVVLVAVATWGGAQLARPAPLALAALAAAPSLWLRRALPLAIALAVTASGLAASAWAALAPAPDAPVTARVRLVSDPEEQLGAQVVVVALPDGRHVQAWSRGRAAASFAHLLAGETIAVRGRLEALPEHADWLRRAHVANRLLVDEAVAPGAASPPWAVANRLRRLVEQGSVGLPFEQRALFVGFVLGDGRDQDPATLDAFRAAGLSHLLVVSGQNVAFVLVVAGPVLARVGRRVRLPLTLAGLVLFALLTRFEPSVLRATAMAAVAAVAATTGRPISGLRVLALAVTALLLVDPLLAGSLGFRLSTAASFGILVVAPRIEAHLRGPRWLVAPLAVTAGAQLGVAPVLIPAFGSMPLAAVPANLVAEPVAGLVMGWGTSGGLLAGAAVALGAPGVARVLQQPTHLGLAWISGVADVAAGHPTPAIGLPVAGGLVAAVAVSSALRSRHTRAIARGHGDPGDEAVAPHEIDADRGSSGGPPTRAPTIRIAVPVVAGLAVGLVVAAVVPPANLPTSVAGVEVRRGGDGPAAVLVDGRADPGRTLDAVRRWDLPASSVAVARSAGSGARATVVALRERGLVDAVLAAPAAGIEGATVVGPGGLDLVVADGVVRLTPDPDDPSRLDVDPPAP